MRDIYNSLMLHDGADSGGELKEDVDPSDLLDNPFVITREDVVAIQESDVIISFANRGRQEDMAYTRLFWFDTSELPSPQVY